MSCSAEPGPVAPPTRPRPRCPVPQSWSCAREQRCRTLRRGWFLARSSTRTQGRRVAIVSNSAGLSSLARDHVLIVALNSRHRQPRPCARAVGGVHPIDLGAAATPEAYAQALRALLADAAVDAIVAVHAANPLLTQIGLRMPSSALWPRVTALPAAQACGGGLVLRSVRRCSEAA